MAEVLVRLERVEDDELVRSALDGDLDAKRQLFERYVSLASAIAFRLTGSDTDLEDIVQDSFIAAFEGLARLAQPAAFRGWLSAIVTRTAIATLRKRRLLRRLGLLRPEPLRMELLTAPSAPPDVVAELQRVYALVERLPAPERVTLILRRLEQLPLEQIAEQTGASLATVKRRLARGEKLLQEAFASREPSR